MEWTELSCGACGVAEHKLLGGNPTHGHLTFEDLKLICCGCGNVSHVLPLKPTVRLDWGREAEGEKTEGVLCEMDWPTRRASED